MRGIVFVLSLLNLAAFAGTGLLAHGLRGRRDRQLRAALLWAANPLLLQVLVAGAHVDGLAVCLAVSAVALFSVSLRYASRVSVSLRYAPRAPLHPTEPQALPAPEPGSSLVPTSGRPLRAFLIAAGAGALAGLASGVKISLVLVLAGLVLAAALARVPHDRPRRQPFAVVTAVC